MAKTGVETDVSQQSCKTGVETGQQLFSLSVNQVCLNSERLNVKSQPLEPRISPQLQKSRS